MISICIITLGRETIYRTLEGIFSQQIDSDFEVIFVLQGTLNTEKIDLINMSRIPYSVYTFPKGLGFSYYRNRAIEKTQGDIIVFIDDDVWTRDSNWLNSLTQKIRKNKYKCVTSGCHISLDHDYWSNCISLLGYPGGGALGFDRVWKLNNNTTNHICGANFSIDKKLLQDIGLFDERLQASCDDNALSDKVTNFGHFIFYEKAATVEHINRHLKYFYKWQLRRMVGFREYTKIVNRKNNFFDKLNNKTFHLKNIFITISTRPKYIFGVFLLLFMTLIAGMNSLFLRKKNI